MYQRQKSFSCIRLSFSSLKWHQIITSVCFWGLKSREGRLEGELPLLPHFTMPSGRIFNLLLTSIATNFTEPHHLTSSGSGTFVAVILSWSPSGFALRALQEAAWTDMSYLNDNAESYQKPLFVFFFSELS